jgi:hypothetical protein
MLKRRNGDSMTEQFASKPASHLPHTIPTEADDLAARAADQEALGRAFARAFGHEGAHVRGLAVVAVLGEGAPPDVEVRDILQDAVDGAEELLPRLLRQESGVSCCHFSLPSPWSRRRFCNCNGKDGTLPLGAVGWGNEVKTPV